MHTHICTHTHAHTHTHHLTHTTSHTAADGVPSDDVYERAVNLATTVYQLEGEGEMATFVPVHENSNQMLRIALLNTKKLFEFITITPSPMNLAIARYPTFRIRNDGLNSDGVPTLRTHPTLMSF